MNQKQLLMYITQVSFALTEVNLYLDTHPCDQKAMEYYQEAAPGSPRQVPVRVWPSPE